MASPDQLADRFVATHREFYDFVKGATPEQWRATGINHPEIQRGEDEGRPVGTIVHHVGTGYRNNRIRCQAWIRGEDPPPPNDEMNRVHAAANPDPDQAETLRFLEEQAGELEAFIRGLGERDLAASGTFATGHKTVEESVGEILPFHIRWHLGSIQATWEEPAAMRPSGASGS